MVGYDFLGNICILKFEKGVKLKEKKKEAERVLKERKSVRSVLEKVEKVKGRLRKIKTRHLAGEKTKEALYKENSCLFKLNVEACYFSPRLANERLEVAKKVKKKDEVLVMFSGVAPYPIVISKLSNCKRVVGIELGRECCRYARENVKLNKLNNIEIIQGDVRRVIPELRKKGERFDVIVMPRPQLKYDFLKEAFSISKKGTRIFYYDFDYDIEKIRKKVIEKARENKKKIKILSIKKAGEIAPCKYRWRVDFQVL